MLGSMSFLSYSVLHVLPFSEKASGVCADGTGAEDFGCEFIWLVECHKNFSAAHSTIQGKSGKTFAHTHGFSVYFVWRFSCSSQKTFAKRLVGEHSFHQRIFRVGESCSLLREQTWGDNKHDNTHALTHTAQHARKRLQNFEYVAQNTQYTTHIREREREKRGQFVRLKL